jgi:hypothetical protein
MPDSQLSTIAWKGPRADLAAMTKFGMRLEGGGTHQSKTMMFAELDAVLADSREPTDLERAVIVDNVLGKATTSTRSLTYRHLSALYGLNAQPPITRVLFALWHAFRCALSLAATPRTHPNQYGVSSSPPKT